MAIAEEGSDDYEIFSGIQGLVFADQPFVIGDGWDRELKLNTCKIENEEVCSPPLYQDGYIIAGLFESPKVLYAM